MTRGLLLVLALAVAALVTSLWTASTAPALGEEPASSVSAASPLLSSQALLHPLPAARVEQAQPEPAPAHAETTPRAPDPELVRTRLELTRVRRELELCHYPETSPRGALVRLPEYEAIEPELRDRIAGFVEEWQVVLLPGEAAWIAERWRLGDWLDWHELGMTDAIEAYLGPGRMTHP